MSNTATEPDKPSFTGSIKVIEKTLERFKSGTLSLEESLALFEEGLGHLRVCQETLNTAKGKVEELVRTMKDGGEVVTKPFQEN